MSGIGKTSNRGAESGAGNKAGEAAGPASELEPHDVRVGRRVNVQPKLNSKGQGELTQVAIVDAPSRGWRVGRGKLLNSSQSRDQTA